MTFEIGQLTLKPTPPTTQPARAWSSAEPPAALEREVSFDFTNDVFPTSPPPEVLEEVDAAWERSAQLAAENRELHFDTDPETGRDVIQVRTLDGEVLRTIPPSRALDVLTGSTL